MSDDSDFEFMMEDAENSSFEASPVGKKAKSKAKGGKAKAPKGKGKAK